MATFQGIGTFNETITPTFVSPTVLSFPLPGLKPSNAADTINAGAGNDNVDGSGGIDRIDGGLGRDIIRGGSGNDDIQAGPELADADPLNDRDSVFGGLGNDFISGGSDDDTLLGDGGNDTISGGLGRDSLIGGSGSDAMSGGDGFDRYDFNAASESVVGNNRDVVGIDTDGVGASLGDQIDLRDVAAGSLTFRGTAAFTGVNQVRVVESVAGNTVVQVNLSGSAAPEMEIMALDGDATAAQWASIDFLL